MLEFQAGIRVGNDKVWIVRNEANSSVSAVDGSLSESITEHFSERRKELSLVICLLRTRSTDLLAMRCL
jgi:hypothetical protein